MTVDQQMTRNALPTLALLLGASLWGLTWMPLQHFNGIGVGGTALILLSYTPAALLLAYLARNEWKLWNDRRCHLLLILLLGGYANIAFVSALIEGEVVRVMLLFYLGPAWGVIGGRIFLHEPLDSQRWMALILALLGAWLVLGGHHMQVATVREADLLALSAGIAFALNNLVFRANDHLPITGKSAAMLSGCVLFAAIALPFQSVELPPLDGIEWIALLGFGLGWILLATLLTQWGVTHMEAGKAAILLLNELLVAVVTATWFNDEILTAAIWTGGALIVSAALLEALRGVRPTQWPNGWRSRP